jgi:hypothetical protein
LAHEAPIVRHTSWLNKICNNVLQLKDFLINNKTKSIGVPVASAGVGFVVHLGVKKLNEKNGEPYFEKVKEHSQEIGIVLSTLGGLLGFAGLVWSNAKENAFLEEIDYAKTLKLAAENEKARLDKIDKTNFSDIERSHWYQDITKQDIYIEVLNDMLNNLEKKLNIIK